VAMLASKSSDQRSDFDTFHCLRCNTVISLTPEPSASKPAGAKEAD
jgi:hypothetical protein